VAVQANGWVGHTTVYVRDPIGLHEEACELPPLELASELDPPRMAHIHVPFLQQNGLAPPEQLGSDPAHPDDMELFCDEFPCEEFACPQRGGHSAISSQHFQFPSGQHRSVLLQEGLFVSLQVTSCELPALLAPEEFAEEFVEEFVEELVEEFLDEELPLDDEAGALDERGAEEEAGTLEERGADEEAGALEERAEDDRLT